jgi:hypothetical protein
MRSLRGTTSLLLAGLAFGVAPAAAGGGTAIVHFRAFSASGAVIGLRPGPSLKGSCFSGSIGLPRPDAWRCMVGNEILDPCLQSPKGAQAGLVCVIGTRGVHLQLTKPLPRALRNRPETAFFAWRLALANGDVCQRFTGTAAGAIQGQGLVYGCTSGGTTTEPTRSPSGWRVRYLARNRSPFKVKKLAALPLLVVVRAIG